MKEIGNPISLDLSDIQVHNNGGRDLFICRLKAEYKDITLCAAGTGNTIKECQDQAQDNLEALAKRWRDRDEPQSCINSYQYNQNYIEHDGSSKFNGGGNKPISSSQINLIEKLGRERHVAPVEKSLEMFGKEINELRGGEANELIRLLKEYPYKHKSRW